MSEYLTTWECPTVGCEYDIKIEYDYTPAQAARTNPDDNPCPAQPAEVDVTAIYRKEPIYIGGINTGDEAWVEWHDETDEQLENWKQEILLKEAEG